MTGSSPTGKSTLASIFLLAILAFGGVASGLALTPLLGAGEAAAPHAGLVPAIVPSVVAPVSIPAPTSTAGHAPFFPPQRPMAGIGNCTTTPVVPGCGFSKEPAPMGIADYGVSGYGHPTPYAYGTTAFLGTVNWTTAYIYSSAQKGDFSVQLNVVLNFINGGQNYSYWIQNVPVPVDTTKNDFAMSYANNIWNFSCASSTCNLATNTVTGNGTDSGGVYVWPASANSGCAGGGTGTCDTLDGPSWFSVEVRSFVNPSGNPEVRFCYYDKSNPTLKCYDTVTFGFAHDVTLDRGFFVDGFSMNPTGLFEDAELTIGGPGNGASTTNTGPSNIHTSLDLWNGHNFQSVPSAWNAGDDTAEALSSDQSIFTNDGSGTPLTVQLNGTTREDFENPAYTTAQVGTLQVWAPGTSTGTVAVQATGWPYTNGESTLTLVPGTYHVWVNGTGAASVDMGMCTVTAAATLNVTTAKGCASSSVPTILTFSASPNPIDLGATTKITTTATGGTGALTYTYGGLPSGCTSSNAVTVSCKPTVTGSFTVHVNVTDTASHLAQANLTLTVNPAISISSFVASPATVNQGSPTTLAVTAAGGTTPLAYAYTGLPSPCKSSSSASIGCTPGTTGTFNVTAWVTDGAGGNASKSTTLTVNPGPTGPTITSFSASPSTITLGGSTTFAVTTTGGTAPLTYVYTNLPAGCTSANTSSLSCTPSSVGTFSSVTVTVTDAVHLSASSSTSLTVNAPPITITAFTATPSTVTLGGSTDLAVTASGGVGTLSYAYSGPASAGCALTVKVASMSCTPTAPGSYTIDVTVTDTSSGLASSNVAITVVLPAGPSITSFIASPSSISLGENTTLIVTASGGVAPLGYAYDGTSLPPGCTNASLASLGCTPTAKGVFTISVTVRDAYGRTSSDQVVLTVSAAPVPALTTPTFHVSPSQITEGATVSFTAGASGGVLPYAYSYATLPTGCSAGNVSSFSCTPSTYGWFNVTVTITDPASQSVTATATLQILPSSTGSGGSGGSGNAGASNLLGNADLWLVVVLVVVAVIVIVAIAASRKKQPDEMSEWSEGPQPYQGPAVAPCPTCASSVPLGAPTCMTCGAPQGPAPPPGAMSPDGGGFPPA